MKKFVFLLLEILSLTIILVTIVGIVINKYHAHFEKMPTYTVVFQDVDSLSVGSPVRLMGKHVGHVVKLELADSQIYVTFRITDPNAKLPDNAYASIQFTGLAGYRSLEIMPSKEKSKHKKLYSIEPIRINSIIEVQTTIFQSILDFCRDIYAFFDKNDVDSTEKTVKKTSKYIKETNQNMDEAILIIKESGKNISKKTKEMHEFLNEQNENFDNVYKSVNTLSSNKNLQMNFESVENSIEKISIPVDTNKINSNISKFSKNVNNLNTKIENLNEKMKIIKKTESEYMNNLKNSSTKSSPDYKMENKN